MEETNKQKDLKMPAFPETVADQPGLSQEAGEYRSMLLKRLWGAYWQREQRWEEFNDLTYSQRYFTNVRAARAYIPPRNNPEETEVVTGTTHQKVIALLSILKAYNFEANVIAYDEENQAYIELGKLMEALVHKVLVLDKKDEQQMLQILEFLQQGDVFVNVYYKQEIKNIKKITKEFDGKEVDWTTEKKKVNGKICTRVIPGINMYLGNIREFFLQSQPYAFTLELMSWADAKVLYGEYDNFQYVSYTVKAFANTTTFRDQTGKFFLFSNLQDGFVEVVKYYDKPNNEYQILLNGVMMLPVKVKKGVVEGFPLTYVSPSGEYPIAKGSGEPLSVNFAYSRSIAEDAKVLQEVNDEFLRLMILKTQMSYKPTRANLSGRQLSRNAFGPGKIIDGIRPDQIPVITENTGVTDAEVKAMNMVRTLIDENTAANVMSGDSESGGKSTATEIQTKKQQSMIKLGCRLVGLTSLHEQIAWLIIYLALDRFTRAEEEQIDEITGQIQKKYKDVMLEAPLEDGKKGLKIMRFSPEDANQSSEMTMVEENNLSDVYQKPVRLFYLNPEMMRQTINWIWEINMVPTPEETTELRKAQFKDTVMMIAANPILSQKANWDFIADRIAMNEDLDPEKLFIIQQAAEASSPMDALMGNAAGGPQQTPQIMQQMKNQQPQGNKANLNTLNNNA